VRKQCGMKKKVKKAKNVRCGVANVKKLRYLCIVFKVKTTNFTNSMDLVGSKKRERISNHLYL
jgi:hypothetical protein